MKWRFMLGKKTNSVENHPKICKFVSVESYCGQSQLWKEEGEKREREREY